MDIKEAIKKIDGKYVLLSEDGKKKLGGPYKTRSEAVNRLNQLKQTNTKESLVWEVNKFDITEAEGEDKGKWLTVNGTALEVGKSKNSRVYSFTNLQENDGTNFNWLVGHREDYDNPDHNVGEGVYSLNESKLDFSGKVKNTSAHPDIIEQIRDGLVAPSVHGGAEKITKRATESGGFEYIIEGLKIPLIALVNKHARGVGAANIEAAIVERFESNDIDETNKEQESDNMTDEKVVKENEVLKTEVKELKDKITKMNEDSVLKEKEALVDKIIELNKELKKDELMEKNIDVLKVIEEYETKPEDKKEEEVKKDEGAGEVTDTEEKAEDASTEEKEVLKDIVVEKNGNIGMNKERYAKFNKEIAESMYR